MAEEKKEEQPKYRLTWRGTGNARPVHVRLVERKEDDAQRDAESKPDAKSDSHSDCDCDC